MGSSIVGRSALVQRGGEAGAGGDGQRGGWHGQRVSALCWVLLAGCAVLSRAHRHAEGEGSFFS